MLFSTKKDIENSEKKVKRILQHFEKKGPSKGLTKYLWASSYQFLSKCCFPFTNKNIRNSLHTKRFFSFLKDPKVSKKPNQCSLIQFCFILFPNMKCGFFCVYHLIPSTKKCLQTRRGRDKVLFFCSFYTMLSCAKLKVWTNVKGLQKHAKKQISLRAHSPF